MHVLEPVAGVLIILAAPELELHVIDYAAAWFFRGRHVGRPIERSSWARA